MGLKCSRPCFSVTVNKPIRDMNCRTDKPVVTVFPVVCPEGSATGPVSVGPDRS